MTEEEEVSASSFSFYLNRRVTMRNHRERIVAVVILCALFLTLPLAWGKLWSVLVLLFGEVPGVDFSVFALLGFAVVAAGIPELIRLMRRDRGIQVFVVFAGIGGLLAALQQVKFGWNSTLFLTSLFYFAVPVAGMLLAREIRRILPVFLLILFVGGFCISLREWGAGFPAVGLSGNWSWHWTLLAISAPSLAFFFPVRFRLAGGILLAFGIAVGQFLISPGYVSRGTLISCIGASAVLFTAGWLHRSPRYRKEILIGLTVAAAIAALAVYYGVRDGFLPSRAPQENRLMLWQGAAALGEAHWGLGVEPGRFEGEIAPYLPVSYFDSDFAADRHTHPHNELLYLWCGFGLFGIVWWTLTTAAGIRGTLRRRRNDELVLLAAWCWLVLLIHGQIDVILSTPLAGGLFALLTGTLAAVGAPHVRSSPGYRGVRIAALAGFGGAAVILLGLNLFSGWNCREGKLALLDSNPKPARQFLERSVSILPTVENLYTLGTVDLFDFHDPSAAITNFKRITSDFKMPSYAHSVGRIARSLAAAGKLKESLPYFEQEQRNFPRSAVNLRLWETVFRALGETKQADRLLSEWRELLVLKGIDESIFPYLLRNQLLDDSPVERKLFLKENGR